MSNCNCVGCVMRRAVTENVPAITLTEPELDKLLSEAYAEGRKDQLEESKEKT